MLEIARKILYIFCPDRNDQDVSLDENFVRVQRCRPVGAFCDDLKSGDALESVLTICSQPRISKG